MAKISLLEQPDSNTSNTSASTPMEFMVRAKTDIEADYVSDVAKRNAQANQRATRALPNIDNGKYLV